MPFVNGGLNAPAITDVVVADLVRDESGRITGYGPLARVTTSTQEGVGHYFPAFMPDGSIFYIANAVPKNSDRPRRFSLRVVDPDREVFFANVFADPGVAAAATAIGELWRRSCRPAMAPFKPGEAAWAFTSLSPAQCQALVEAHFTGADDERRALVAACATSATADAGNHGASRMAVSAAVKVARSR